MSSCGYGNLINVFWGFLFGTCWRTKTQCIHLYCWVAPQLEGRYIITYYLITNTVLSLKAYSNLTQLGNTHKNRRSDGKYRREWNVLNIYFSCWLVCYTHRVKFIIFLVYLKWMLYTKFACYMNKKICAIRVP